MNKVGKFSKVSFGQFLSDMKSAFGNRWNEEEIHSFYNEIKLPKRATVGSAGYDFYSPIPFSLSPWEEIKIPTGIRVSIDDGWFLECLPRSGLGFKHAMRLLNTCGVIDSDYAYSSNEGHIWAKVRLERWSGTLPVNSGDAFMQTIFLPYGVAYDDNTNGIRDGGFGSTSN